MRTNIDIDDKIMQDAMRAGGFKTKKETVEAALKALARQRKSQRKILELFGKIEFDPAYDHRKMRESKIK
ncbi:MAG: type II toxin-antitoxin system VapB family antitoxin [Nitrosomonadales bacterium]|nr:type II toxin-antitoxin system VapB family antitoxin [Nitrosomonadales bacterium]